MTNKPNTMRCAVCGRMLMRAAALKGGQPVGRTCAINKGLLQVRARSTQGELDLGVTLVPVSHPAPCANTIDLFEAAT